MRPSPEELLLSLRVSLNDTLLPAVTDRWARYVGTAMDLLLQHLQLRLVGENDALVADNADMASTLASLGQRFPALTARVAFPEPNGASATAVNEAWRAQVIEAMRWADSTEEADADLARDELHRLIRRQVDRVTPLVEPLFMSFRPAEAAR